MEKVIQFFEKYVDGYVDNNSLGEVNIDSINKLAGVVHVIRMYRDSEKGWGMREKEFLESIRIRDEENAVLRKLNDTYRVVMDRQVNGKAD